MKKATILIILITMFLLGLFLGNENNDRKNELFMEAKEEFEKEITNPLNNYEPRPLVPYDYKINKIAKIVEEKIEKIIEKIT